MQDMTVGQFLLLFLLPILLGIATTIIVFLTKTYFNDSFMPWYKSRMEKSYVVRGKWGAVTNPSYDDSKQYKETIYIQQLSERVCGDIFYEEEQIDSSSDEKAKAKHFKFEGSFSDSVLSATYWNPDREQKGRGTFCLYSKNSDTLQGKYSWYEPEVNRVESGDYVWRKLK